MPVGGEMNCLSSRAGSGDLSRSFFLRQIPGVQRCQKLIRVNHLLFKFITAPRDRVIAADYLGSEGSNIIGKDITPQWDMNI